MAAATGPACRPGILNRLLVQKRSTSLLGGKHFVARGIVHHTCDATSLMFKRERNAKNGKAVGEVGGAIERIDVPQAIFAAGIEQALLFSLNVMFGPMLTDALAN